MTQDSSTAAQGAAEERSQDDLFVHAWFEQLLAGLQKASPENAGVNSVRECSLVHYRAIQMDDILAPYRGDLPGFIQFLSEKWGWKVDYDPAGQVLTADENKPYCVCPVVKLSTGPVSDMLCNCSEGFAERMFSAVAGRPVKARVLRSVLRGNPTCVYQIQLQ